MRPMQDQDDCTLTPAAPDEEINRSIVEASRDCLKILDLDGRLIYINPEGLRHLDIEDPGAVLHQRLIDFLEGPDRQAAQEAMARATTGSTGRFKRFVRTPAGVVKWWDVIVSPITDVSGNVVQLLAVSREITEARREKVFQAGQHQVLKMIATGAPLEEVLNCLVRLVEHQCEGMLCSVLHATLNPAHVRLCGGLQRSGHGKVLSSRVRPE